MEVVATLNRPLRWTGLENWSSRVGLGRSVVSREASLPSSGIVDGPVNGPDQKSRSCLSLALRAADIVACRAWPMDRVRLPPVDLVEPADDGVCGLDGHSLRRLVDDSSSDSAPA